MCVRIARVSYDLIARRDASQLRALSTSSLSTSIGEVQQINLGCVKATACMMSRADDQSIRMH